MLCRKKITKARRKNPENSVTAYEIDWRFDFSDGLLKNAILLFIVPFSLTTNDSLYFYYNSSHYRGLAEKKTSEYNYYVYLLLKLYLKISLARSKIES